MAKPIGSRGTQLLAERIAEREVTQTWVARELTKALKVEVGQSYVWSLLQGAEPGIRRALLLEKILDIPVRSWLQQPRS